MPPQSVSHKYQCMSTVRPSIGASSETDIHCPSRRHLPPLPLLLLLLQQHYSRQCLLHAAGTCAADVTSRREEYERVQEERDQIETESVPSSGAAGKAKSPEG